MSVANGEGIAVIESMVRMVKAIAPNKEAIRQQVEEIIEERVPRRLEVRSGDLTLSTITERRRPEFERIVKAIALGGKVNVALVGPAGSGKTTLVMQAAEALGARFGCISCTAGVSESHFLGTFAPTGEHGRHEFLGTEFLDLYENGGIFLADEYDAADANVVMCLNTGSSNGFVYTRNPLKRKYTRHPNFRLVVAMNTWGHGADRQYVGRAQLDASTLDRFCAARFFLGYDVEYEREVGDPDLVAWVHLVREGIATHKIRRIASTRLIEQGTALILGNVLSLGEVQENYLLDWASEERRKVGV